MANTGYYKQLKDLVDNFTDADGKILSEPKGRLGSKSLDSRTINILRKFVTLLLENRMISIETKLYITDMYITYNGVADRMEKLTGQKPNVNTVQTKLWNDKGKIVRYFGESMILDLTEYKDISKLDEYEEKLRIAYAKFGNDKVLNNLALEIPKYTDAIVEDIEQDKFEQFLSVIAPYSKQHMKFISENLDKDAINYCRFILTSGSLSSKDKYNKERLLELIGN